MLNKANAVFKQLTLQKLTNLESQPRLAFFLSLKNCLNNEIVSDNVQARFHSYYLKNILKYGMI